MKTTACPRSSTHTEFGRQRHFLREAKTTISPPAPFQVKKPLLNFWSSTRTQSGVGGGDGGGLSAGLHMKQIKRVKAITGQLGTHGIMEDVGDQRKCLRPSSKTLNKWNINKRGNWWLFLHLTKTSAVHYFSDSGWRKDLPCLFGKWLSFLCVVLLCWLTKEGAGRRTRFARSGWSTGSAFKLKLDEACIHTAP